MTLNGAVIRQHLTAGHAVPAEELVELSDNELRHRHRQEHTPVCKGPKWHVHPDEDYR